MIHVTFVDIFNGNNVVTWTDEVPTVPRVGESVIRREQEAKGTSVHIRCVEQVTHYYDYRIGQRDPDTLFVLLGPWTGNHVKALDLITA